MIGWLVVRMSVRLMAFMKPAALSSQSLTNVGRKSMERRSMEKEKEKNV